MDTQKNSSFIFSVLVLFFFLFDSTFSLIDQADVQNDGSQGHSLSKLFLFGDSYLDTGNNNLTVRCWKFPYGIAVPGVPTGRYSDGLIFTDFLASFMGIDSPLPYTQWIILSKSRVTFGMNFAHGGTGVFDTWMKEGNMTTQINSFKQYIANGVYNQRELDESIAVVSNAGNDYTQYYAVDRGTHEEYQAFAAKVIDQLELNLREIKKIG